MILNQIYRKHLTSKIVIFFIIMLTLGFQLDSLNAKCKVFNKAKKIDNKTRKSVNSFLKKITEFKITNVKICINKRKFYQIKKGKYHKSVYDKINHIIYLRRFNAADLRHELFHHFIQAKLGNLPYTIHEKLVLSLENLFIKKVIQTSIYDFERVKLFLTSPINLFYKTPIPNHLIIDALMIFRANQYQINEIHQYIKARK